MLNSKLYAITDTQLSNCIHVEIVERMLAGGARIIQLRDKELGSKEFFDAARDCLKLTQAARALLIINDRVEIAHAAGADGVHLGQGDLSVEEAREVLGAHKIIGVSTHSLLQFEAALKTSANYLAVGPVYSTTTKEDADPVVGLEFVKQARALTSLPIVAIGGINLTRAPEVIAAGASSVAVISALYPMPELPKNDFAAMMSAKPDIEGSVRKFLEVLRKE
jgi:thiamine-phosphate pyrophosphorylase